MCVIHNFLTWCENLLSRLEALHIICICCWWFTYMGKWRGFGCHMCLSFWMS